VPEYLYCIKIKITHSDFLDTRLLRSDHIPTKSEVVYRAFKELFACDPQYYENASVVNYRLHAIDGATIDEESLQGKIVFLGTGGYTYLVTYYRDCIGHITHGYAQLTLDHPITEFSVQDDYQAFEVQIHQYINDPISGIHVLLHSPVD